MGVAIPLVKATILNLVKSGSNIPKWVLTAFNDQDPTRPDAKVVLETKDSEELKLAAEALSIGAGSSGGKESVLRGNY